MPAASPRPHRLPRLCLSIRAQQLPPFTPAGTLGSCHLGILQQVFKASDGDGAVTGVLPTQRLLQLPQLLFSFPHI